MYREEAQKELNELGADVEIFYEKSEEKKGKILGQSPQEGVEVVPGEKVELIVSNGFETFSMKNVVGMKEEKFDEWINEKNLNSTKLLVCSDLNEKGEILKQTPKEGEEIKENGIVNVEISSGTCPKEGQDVVTKNESEDKKK